MHWTLLLPGALVPAPVVPEIARSDRAPSLTRALRRATVREDEASALAGDLALQLAWGAREFGAIAPAVAGNDLQINASAPQAWRALGGSAKPAVAKTTNAEPWFCDPVHFALMRDHVVLHALDRDRITDAEADELVQAAADVALRHGATITRSGDQWFVLLPADWEISALPLASALGLAIQDRLPDGPAAPGWRKLLTSIQMRWHEHPVNVARSARGQLVINGLWLHGGGEERPLPRSRFAAAVLRDPTLRGWAYGAGVRVAGDAAGLGPEVRAGGNVLEEWNDLFEPARAEHWGLWLERLAELDARFAARVDAAFAHGCSRIDVILCGEERVRCARIARADRWRAWRHHPMAAVLVDSAPPAASEAAGEAPPKAADAAG